MNSCRSRYKLGLYAHRRRDNFNGRYKVEGVEKTPPDADPPESDPKLDLLLEILARMP